MSGFTRRDALLTAAAAALAGGCGSGRGSAHTKVGPNPGGLGSTLVSTWRDPTGAGTLTTADGEPLIKRTDLAPAAQNTRVLATLAHVTDAHVLDAASPARVPFLRRLGSPFQSTFRPQETLTAQVLAGAVAAIDALHPDAVIQGGDLIDNDQANELARALAVLNGGPVRFEPYVGVQSARDADPFYYRPDLDAPRHPGLLHQATRPFTAKGLKKTPWYPVLGDHDILVAGEVPPNPTTQALATGTEALWELPPHLTVPPGATLTTTGSPDGPPVPGLVSQFIDEALRGPKSDRARPRRSPRTRSHRGDRRSRRTPETHPRLRRRSRAQSQAHRPRPRPPRRRLRWPGPPRTAWLASQPARWGRRALGHRGQPPATPRRRGRR